jgi:predicted phosphodiesterase
MNILVISDLHIGNNDHFETFGWDVDDFINAVEMIRFEEKIDKIILNGDIFELYKYSFTEIYKNNKKLIDYLTGDNFILLKGNHDAICSMGVDNFTLENSEGKRIYIEHGHSADFMNGTRLGRKIQTISFNLLRWLSRHPWILKVYFRIVEFDDAINRIPKKYDSYKYLKHALNLLKSYDFVVLGHTHKIEAHKTYYLNHKKHYVNSGSCSMGRFQGVVIDTESMKYETLKFKNKQALFKEYRKVMKPVYALSA